MSDRYWAYACEGCGVVIGPDMRNVHRAFHDQLNRLAAALLTQEGQDVAFVPEEPEPLLCGECGTEIEPDDGGCPHLADNDDPGHAVTLTSLSGPAAVRTSAPEPPTSVAPAGEDHGAPDEPPPGWPGWYDGEWWIKAPGAGYYRRLLGSTGCLFWSEMTGAVPASAPGESS